MTTIANAVYPSLSEDGWEQSTIKVADYLMSCFLVSDYSQSYIYARDISSFPWILQHTASDIPETIRLTEATLTKYFSRYYTNVLVEVREVPNPSNPSVGQISIYVQFTDLENTEYTLGRLLSITNLTVTKIINLNNTGSEQGV